VGKTWHNVAIAHVRKHATKRGTSYQVCWRLEGKYVSVTFASRDVANKFRGKVDASGQRYPEGWIPGHGFVTQQEEAPELTLRDWFPRAIAARAGASSGSKEKYRRDFNRHVPDELKDMPLTSITAEMAGTWVAGLLMNISAKSAHNIHGLVSSVLNQAVRDELVRRNVFVQLGPKLAPSRAVTLLEPDDVELLLSCFGPPYGEFTEWLYKSGMRFSEAIALQWKDIDFGRGQVHVVRAFKREGNGTLILGPPKTTAGSRTIAMPADLLARLATRRQGPTDHLFLNKHGNLLTQSVYFKTAWEPALAAAQAKGLNKTPRIHDLRHSHASLLLERGVPILTVSRRLGHSSVAVTGDVYGHLMATSDEAVLAALG
jgi:integrase